MICVAISNEVIISFVPTTFFCEIYKDLMAFTMTLEKLNNQIDSTSDNKTDPQWNSIKYTKSSHVTINYQLAENNHCLINDTLGAEQNSIKILRTHLLSRMRANRWRTVMITSAQPGEGKTVTAINLAFAMAREYHQTIALVDCDMRKPSIAKYLGINNTSGIADYLLNEKPLNEIMVWPGVEKLILIAGNKAIPDSSEIIGSLKMKTMVAEMKYRYHDRYIIFDLPPLLSVPDPLVFMPLVDCVLLIVEAGGTSTRDIQKAQSLIPPEKLLGLVLNKDDSPQKEYYY